MIFILFIVLLSIINSQAKSDTKLMNGKLYQIYRIHEDNSADIIMQYSYINENNVEIPFMTDINYTISIISFSKEPTFNHSIYFVGINKEFKVVNYSTKNFGEIQVNETIIESVMRKGDFLHRVNYKAYIGNSTSPAGSLITLNINFNINNISYIYKGVNELFLRRINTESFDEVNNYFQMKVDLPDSPDSWTEYISSNIEPSRIISKGTAQSLIWDYYPKYDIILTYSVIENPLSKKINNLIEETNLVSKQAQKSGDIALSLGFLAFLLTIISIDYKILKTNLKKIYNYISSKIKYKI